MPWQKLRISNERIDIMIRWTYFVVAPILLGLVVGVLVYNNTTNARLAALAQQIKEQNERIITLNKEVDTVSKDNKSLNIQTRNYTKCGFQLFAKYTRDYQPITINNLSTCQIELSSPTSLGASVQVHAGSNQVSSSKAPTSSSSFASGQATSQGSSDISSSNGNTPSPPPQQNILQRTVSGIVNAVKGIF